MKLQNSIKNISKYLKNVNIKLPVYTFVSKNDVQNNSNINVIKATSSDIKNFKKNFTKEELEKFLDPYGFLNSDYNKSDENNKVIKSSNNEFKINDNNKNHNLKIDPKDMPKEYGIKPRGKEPTRYGDWEINGKCVDF